jgi:hypothetical protein
MQLEIEDFAESIREIDGSKDPLAVQNFEPAGKPCPQCMRDMTRATLEIGGHALGGVFLHCTTHGLWVPRDAMTAAFARASRRGGFRGRGATTGARGFGGPTTPADTASFVANMPSAHSGMSGAIASIASAFAPGAPASSGLAISHWEARRPRAHTLFVSAHRDRQLACPACKTTLAYQGDRWACTGCAGLFVESEALVAMIREMALVPWEMPVVTGSPGERRCPICSTAMQVELLEGVAIDRCASHGVWFDDHELEATLHHASAPPTGLGAWLRRLFGR